LLQIENKDLKERLDMSKEYENMVEESTGRILDLDSQVADLTAKLKDLEAYREMATELEEHFTEETRNLRRQLEDAEVRRAESQRALESAEEKVKTSALAISSYRERCEDLENQLSLVKDDRASTLEESEQMKEVLRNSKAAEARCEEVQTKLTDLTESYQRLRSDHVDAQKRLASANSENQRLLTELQASSSQSNVLSTLEKRNQELEHEIAELEPQLQAAKANAATRDQELRAAQQRITQMSKEIAEYEEAVQEYENELKNAVSRPQTQAPTQAQGQPQAQLPSGTVLSSSPGQRKQREKEKLVEDGETISALKRALMRTKLEDISRPLVDPVLLTRRSVGQPATTSNSIQQTKQEAAIQRWAERAAHLAVAPRVPKECSHRDVVSWYARRLDACKAIKELDRMLVEIQ
jgi:chromosome segregation ATPase